MLLGKAKYILVWCGMMMLFIMNGAVVRGQRTYATVATTSGATSGVTITNATNAQGASTTTPPASATPAKIAISVTGTNSASGYIQLRFAPAVTLGRTVYVKVSNPGTNVVKATVYNGTNAAAGTDANLIAMNDGSYYYAVSATSSFDAVRITLEVTGVVIFGGSGTIDVYHAFYQTTDCGTGVMTSFSGGGLLGGNVNFPAQAIDGNYATYSTLIPAAVASSVQQTFYFSGSSTNTEEVKLRISAPPAPLISLTLLNSITINAYNGSATTPVWSAALGGLLSVDLLGLLRDGTPITIVLAPGAKFDRVSINFGSVANLFTNLYIHEVERTPSPPTFVVQNTTICANNTATLTASAPDTGYEIRWYNSSGSLLHTGASFTTPALTTTTTYYTAKAKTGCSVETLQLPAVVTVNPSPTIAAITPVSICPSASVQLTTLNPAVTNTATGGTYVWSATQGGTAISNTSVSPATTTTYWVRYTKDGCYADQSVAITVKPLPTLSSAIIASVCSKNLFSYTAVSSVSGTIFSWTRAAVTGITNAASSGNTDQINETLVNTTSAPIDVLYSFSLSANGCPGTGTLTLTVKPQLNNPTVNITSN